MITLIRNVEDAKFDEINQLLHCERTLQSTFRKEKTKEKERRRGTSWRRAEREMNMMKERFVITCIFRAVSLTFVA